MFAVDSIEICIDTAEKKRQLTALVRPTDLPAVVRSMAALIEQFVIIKESLVIVESYIVVEVTVELGAMEHEEGLGEHLDISLKFSKHFQSRVK
jgi:hypothetical protein